MHYKCIVFSYHVVLKKIATIREYLWSIVPKDLRFIAYLHGNIQSGNSQQ